MSYLGDILSSQILYFPFTTVDSTGLPAALASGTVSIYKDDGTTESTAGVTLTASFDSRTGLNMVKVDTSADGTFYAINHDFSAIITTGFIGSTSIAGYVVGTFSIDNRRGIAAGLLRMDLSGFTGEAARSVLNAFRFLRNKWTISGTTLSVKKEDDTTEAWNATLSTTAGVSPVTTVDPS